MFEVSTQMGDRLVEGWEQKAQHTHTCRAVVRALGAEIVIGTKIDFETWIFKISATFIWTCRNLDNTLKHKTSDPELVKH